MDTEEKKTQMTPAESQALFAARLGLEGDDAQAYPAGKARPADGWHPYLSSTDLLIELRLVRPTSGNLILRAITADEFREHGILGVKTNTLEAVAYEVIAIANDVPEKMGILVGMHCMHLSAAADRVDQLSDDGLYFQVFHEDLSMFWEPRDMELAMEAIKDCETLDEVRAVVAARLGIGDV